MSESQGDPQVLRGETVARAAFRGVVGAMAMTGMRAFTVNAGIVEEAPPQAVFRQRVLGVLKPSTRKQRRAATELAHWGYGGAGGAAFGMLPDQLRLRPWAGPAYGIGVWLGFELCVAPLLGLSQAKRARVVERAALAADHVLYGLVLSEVRRRPRE